VPLVDFCNCVDPQAQPRPRQTPPHECGVATTRRVAPPPKSRRQLGCHSSGVTATLVRLRNPRVDLLRRHGFTPNGSTQTPSVAHRCRPRPGNVRERRLAGNQSLRRLLSKPLEDLLARRAAYPDGPRRAFEGRQPLPLAKATSADRTQGAFHPSDLLRRPMGISAHRPRSTTKLPPPPTSK